MTFRPVTATSAAELDIANAASGYELVWPGLGDRFLDRLREIRIQIEHAPDSCTEVYPGVRRALMHHFPFGVLYRVLPDQVQIIAVLPDKADPAKFDARAQG